MAARSRGRNRATRVEPSTIASPPLRSFALQGRQRPARGLCLSPPLGGQAPRRVVPVAILGAHVPNLDNGQWRWFYTQQHGDNRTYEVVVKQHGDN